MAQVSISDLYRGEGQGEKYGGILNSVMREVFTNGVPEGCSEQTWIELLTVKHTFLVAERMKTEGDVVSELSKAASPFCCAKMRENGSGAQCAPESKDQSGAPPTPDGTRRGVTE